MRQPKLGINITRDSVVISNRIRFIQSTMKKSRPFAGHMLEPVASTVNPHIPFIRLFRAFLFSPRLYLVGV